MMKVLKGFNTGKVNGVPGVELTLEDQERLTPDDKAELVAGGFLEIGGSTPAASEQSEESMDEQPQEEAPKKKGKGKG